MVRLLKGLCQCFCFRGKAGGFCPYAYAEHQRYRFHPSALVLQPSCCKMGTCISTICNRLASFPRFARGGYLDKSRIYLSASLNLCTVQLRLPRSRSDRNGAEMPIAIARLRKEMPRLILDFRIEFPACSWLMRHTFSVGSFIVSACYQTLAKLSKQI